MATTPRPSAQHNEPTDGWPTPSPRSTSCYPDRHRPSHALRQARCRCKADPPTLHGPYIQWTRTVEGKTVTRFLSEEQLGRYQPWFDNARRLRELIAELEALSLRAAEQTEHWNRHQHP